MIRILQDDLNKNSLFSSVHGISCSGLYFAFTIFNLLTGFIDWIYCLKHYSVSNVY